MIIDLIKFFDLHNGEDEKSKVLENVHNNISFRGSNLWILACAIVIASVGLNINSTAVVIGAMLISPLMGPIVGAGFSLGIFDFNLLKKSIKNLLTATGLSLIVSTLYFVLSPFKESQPEILARTSPTIFDVIIGFFGGLVGVIAITRKEKGNTIPGVAIATALMPPLCTAGYGLAVGNFSFFFGALFLYTINCVFICISTFIIVKFLKYPAISFVDREQQKRIRYIISAVVLLMIVPSTFFAYQLLNEKKFKYRVEAFVKEEFKAKGYTLVVKNIDVKSKPKIIELGCLNKKFDDKEISYLKKRMEDFDLSNARLIIKQDTTDIKNAILSEINKSSSLINEKDILIAQLKKEIEENNFNNHQFLRELQVMMPKIVAISIANHELYQKTDSARVQPVMIYKSKEVLSKEEITMLRKWLQNRLNKQNVSIIAY